MMSPNSSTLSPRQVREACERHFCPPKSVVLPNGDFDNYKFRFSYNSPSFKAYKNLPIFWETFHPDRPQYWLKDFNLFSNYFFGNLVHYEGPAKIVELRKLFKSRVFQKFNGIQTLVPLRYVYGIFMNCINELRMTVAHAIDQYKQFPLFVLIACLNLEDLPLECYKYSSVSNVKCLHSQIPALMYMLFMSSKPDITENYYLLFTLQQFIHFYHRNLHYTNPTAILCNNFVVQMTDFCTDLVLVRPIVSTELVREDGVAQGPFDRLFSRESIDLEKDLSNKRIKDTRLFLQREFQQWHYSDTVKSQAQISVDANVRIDPEFLNSVNKLTEVFSEAAGNLHNLAGNAIDSLRKKFACYLSICYNLYRFSTKSMSFQDVFMNITTSIMQSDIPTHLLPQFKKLFLSSSAQLSMEETKEFIPEGSLILKLLSISAFVLMVRQIPGKQDIDTFIGRLDRVPKALSGIESIWTRLDSITSSLWTWIEITLLKRENRIPRSEILDSVTKWVNELSRLLALASRREIQNNKETQEAAGRMYSEGVKLMRQCKELNLCRSNMELIARNLPAAKLLLDEANASGANLSKIRTEPVIVWFAGASGNGKTGLTLPFTLDMMRTFGDIPDNWEELIFIRMVENVYFEGLTPQKEYFIYDEFIQSVDNVLKPNPELFEIIRLGNMFPYQAHMATLQDKSNTFAEPKLMVLTSNKRTIRVESLNCPEAVSRRIDFAYDVHIAPEFVLEYEDANGDKKQRLDEAKARKTFGEELCLQVYRLDRFDPTSGKVIEKDLTYNQAVAQCQEAMRRRAEKFTKAQDFLEAYRKKGQAVYDREPENEFSFLQEDMVNMSTAQWGFDCVTHSYPSISKTPWYERFLDKTLLTYYKSKCRFLNYMYGEENIYVDYLSGRRDYAIGRCKEILAETRRLISVERSAILDTISRFLGPYWTVFKTVARVALGLVAFYVCGKAVVKKFSGEDLPSYIKEDESLLTLTKRANACIDKGCSDCMKCFHKNTDLCIKWYTKCSCYAAQMEKTKTFLKHYAVAAYYQEPEQRDERDQCIELISIVEQMCNCDCVSCEACCDSELIEKFKDVSKVYGIPCVCICARLSQGFSLPEILYLVRVCGNIHPSPISNMYLQKLYRKMTTDVTSFEQTPEAATIRDSLNLTKPTPLAAAEQMYDTEASMRLKQRAVPRISYQSNDDEANMRVKQRIAPRLVYQSEEIKKPVDVVSDSLSSQEQRALPENDCSVDTIVNNVVYPNTCFMTAGRSDGTEVNIGHVLFIRGQVALMPYHYRVAIEERDFKYVKLYSRVRISCKIPISYFDTYIRIPEKDAMLVTFPVTVNAFKDIVGHFVDTQKYPNIPSCPAVLAKFHFENGETERSRVYINSIGVSERDEVDTMSVPGCLEIVRNRDFYSYSAPTRAGDCGAALVVANTTIPNKIIGIHISGVPGLCKGNSSALSKQMLLKALRGVPSIAQYSYPSSELSVPQDMLEESGSFVLHSFHKDERINASMSSSIAKTPIFGRLIVSPNKPGRLRAFTNKEGETIDPILLQRKKYGIPRPVLDQNIVDDIKEAIKPMYYQSHDYEPEFYKYPLTTEQAIVGIDGDPYITSIDRTTSPGYPDVLAKRIKPGKKDWFGEGMEYDLTTPKCAELFQRIEDFKISVRDGIRPEVVWIDTLKDQKIPIAKADIGKTRLFAASGIVYAVALREICAPFLAHLARKRIDNSICVGINPFSTEWTQLAHRIQRKGKRVIAGDYSNFDGTLPAQLVFAATEIFSEWYSLNWDYVVAHKRNVIGGIELTKCQFLDYCIRLYYECVHHLHITNVDGGTLLYYVRNGIPSGCPVTAPINSVVGNMALAYCWMQIYRGTAMHSMEAYLSHTSGVFYGDDFILNIREDAIDKFNQITITEAMKEYLDMTMTDETKSGQLVVSRTIDEVTFLKRSFRFEPLIQEFVAPLDLTVILDSTNWYKVGAAPALLTSKQVIEACTRELSLHDVSVDNTWRSKIVQLGIEVCQSIPGEDFVHNTRYSTLMGVKDNTLMTSLE